jgi:hypothetical protein
MKKSRQLAATPVQTRSLVKIAIFCPRVNTKKRLAPLHFEYLFLRGKLGLGTGMAMRFAKAPAGISAFIFETKRDSAKEGGRP